PKFFTDFLLSILHYTAENVARDLSGLVTVSAAFPGNVYIVYGTPAVYNLEVKDRIYKVEIVTREGPLDLRATVKFGKAKAGINGIDKKLDKVSTFLIEKAGEKFDIREG
ncbi:MAG: hypothetical protein QXU40_02325, partial [Candidatus Pacearchaeota archaeon]